ncbi:MAG: TIGR04282 family arsenosugar biosynthesis glycosyltransferase [Pseudomonadota bacterium]
MAERSVVGSTTLLVQFAKSPLHGAVKTRMQPTLSPAESLTLHCELMVWTTRRLLDAGLGDVQLHVAGALDHPLLSQLLSLGLDCVLPQRGVDLGERMCAALITGLESFDRVVLIGSDCPAIDRAYLHAAVHALQSTDVVIGPAMDGGYVLVGARRIESAIFTDIDWGSERVLAQTARRLDASSLTWQRLAPLCDIDRPRDLPHWQALRASEPTLAVVPWPLSREIVER